MKIPVLFLLSLLTSLQLFSQERIPVELVNTQFNINILAPSVSFEFRVNDQQSVAIDGGITSIIVTNQFDETEVSITPFIRGAFRHYYPRKKVKKMLRPNSGNYIGLVTGYNFNTPKNDDLNPDSRVQSFYLGPVWGIQRNYLSGIHLGLSLGPGLGVGNGKTFFTGVGSFEFGFVIGGKGR